MAGERTLAVDCKYLGAGTPGDGVAATTYTQYPEIHEDTIVFNFADGTQVQFRAMGQKDPWAVISRITDVSSIEFAIPSPKAQEQVDFMGGTATGEKWEAPVEIPKIIKSIKMQTADYQGKYVEYVIPKAEIFARLSQAPGVEQTDLMLVRATVVTPITSAGVRKSSFSREVKTVDAEAGG
uniref:hypothetical protein n=1 Tax=uncultured Dysgonomonas sp. TaxID=206096 RepID=UPI00262929DF|nr:hypothetical protein [uncultured Dysgonomonas sp.]